ncbi:MAG: thiopurine S-methyltransferase [Pseudomonadota bacterium]
MSEGAAFWLERWNKGEIGFHRDAPHGALDRHWDKLGVDKQATVFVPLCGKSNDMRWLAQRGHSVVGVELAKKALEDFYTEGELVPTVSSQPPFEVLSAAPYKLLCGDLFDLSQGNIDHAAAVYDRASLIALPPKTQPRFAEKLSDLLPTGAAALVITLDYDDNKMDGPPFSTPPEVVQSIFAATFEIDELSREEVLDLNSPLRTRGLTEVFETCYMLHRKS